MRKVFKCGEKVLCQGRLARFLGYSVCAKYCNLDFVEGGRACRLLSLVEKIEE